MTARPNWPASKVEIEGSGDRATVKIDGHMLACTSAVLAMDAVSLPELTVSLPVADDIVITLDGTITVLQDETRAALIAMGWTPPPGPVQPAPGKFDPDLCHRCDVYIGYGALGVAVAPAQHAEDDKWLRSHCWVCERSREEITSGR